jgi:tetratricopeptide (TPR) repeat protein
MYNLALSYARLGRHAEALKLNEETLTLRKAKLGSDHPDTLLSMNNLANSYDRLGGHAEALKLHEETLTLRRARLGPDHRDTLVSMGNLALSYAALGRHAEALKLRQETLALRKAKLGPNHPDTLSSMNDLAWSLATTADVKLRDPKRAIELATKAAQVQPNNTNFQGTLGTARYQAGEWKEAIANLEQALKLRKAEDPRNANEGFFLAMAHWRLGDKDKARVWFDKSVAWMARDKDDPELKRFRAESAELLGVKDGRK